MLRNPPSGESDSSANTEGAHPAHSDGGFLLSALQQPREVTRDWHKWPAKQSGPTGRNPLSRLDYAPPWNRTKNLLIKSPAAAVPSPNKPSN